MPIPKYYVRPDGLHEAIITVNGKRKAFRGKTDREVWNKIKAYRAEAEKPKTVPFESVAHAWWNEIEPTLAANTHKGYSPAYDRAVAQFGPEDVSTITAKEIETYINQFAKTHAKKTVITQRQIIRQILNKAQREGYISFNPAESVLLPKNLAQKKRHAPPADQIQKIKDSINDEFGLFAFLIYYTGCRRGEAEGLMYEDIDRKKMRISIRRSVRTGSSPAAMPLTKSAPASPSPRMRSATATRLPCTKQASTTKPPSSFSVTPSSPQPWTSIPISSTPALTRSPPKWTRRFNCPFYCVGYCVHTRVFSCYFMLGYAKLIFSLYVCFSPVLFCILRSSILNK